MAKNDVGTKTPEMVMQDYIKRRAVSGTDYVFDGVDCVVVSVNYASGKSSLVTKIKRKDDVENENLRTEQKG